MDTRWPRSWLLIRYTEIHRISLTIYSSPHYKLISFPLPDSHTHSPLTNHTPTLTLHSARLHSPQYIFSSPRLTMTCLFLLPPACHRILLCLTMSSAAHLFWIVCLFCQPFGFSLTRPPAGPLAAIQFRLMKTFSCPSTLWSTHVGMVQPHYYVHCAKFSKTDFFIACCSAWFPVSTILKSLFGFASLWWVMSHTAGWDYW